MLQGTGSDVGKSVIVARLARAFTLRGLKVMPFKPQNMSTNAAVTSDGRQVSSAQGTAVERGGGRSRYEAIDLDPCPEAAGRGTKSR